MLPRRERTDLAEFAREYIKSHEGDLEMKALTVNSDPNGGYLTLPNSAGSSRPTSTKPPRCVRSPA